MTVIYPTVLGGSKPPGAITFGRETYTIDRGSGAIDCPPEREDEIAAHLAEHHGVDPADILERDEPPDDPTVPDHTRDDGDDYDGMTYDELYAEAQERDVPGRSEMDSDELRDALRED